jgi:hypothetical protein
LRRLILEIGRRYGVTEIAGSLNPGIERPPDLRGLE